MRCHVCRRTLQHKECCSGCAKVHYRKIRHATYEDADQALSEINAREYDKYLHIYKCWIGHMGEHWHLGHYTDRKNKKRIDKKIEKQRRKALWKDKECV